MHGVARKLMWGSSPVGAAGSDRPDDHDVVIVLASLLCALITVLGIGLVARCACGRGRAQAAAAAAANRGVKKSVLRKIPTVPYVAPSASAACAAGGDAESGEPAEEAEAAECAICLAEFEEGESMRVLPHCGHAASRLKQTTGGEVRVAGAEVPVAGVPGGGGSRASRDLRFVSCVRGLTHNPSQPAS